MRTEQALQREGLSGDEARRALEQPPLRTVALEGEDEGGEGVAFVASLVLYLQLIMYGIAVASGVVEEKSSRVIEVLLADGPAARDPRRQDPRHRRPRAAPARR